MGSTALGLAVRMHTPETLLMLMAVAKCPEFGVETVPVKLKGQVPQLPLYIQETSCRRRVQVETNGLASHVTDV